MNKQLLVLTFAATIGLGGCASVYSDPHYKDTSVPRREKIADAEMRDKLSYLARYVLTADDRQKQRARIQKEYPGWTEFDTHTALAMGAAQLSSGNIFSRGGSNTFGNVSLALSVASMLLPDGSMDNTSGFYLPAKLDGVALESAEAARDAFWQWREKELAQAAKALQRESRCIYQCDSPALRVYELRTIANGQPDPRYIYNPQVLYVRTELFQGSMKPVIDDPVQSWALGFVPKWSAGDGNVAPVVLMDARLDESGKPQFKENAPLITSKDPMKTPLGRDFYRRFYANSDFDFFVMSGIFKDWLGYRGEIYGYSFRNSGSFIHYKAVEKAPPQPESGVKG